MWQDTGTTPNGQDMDGCLVPTPTALPFSPYAMHSSPTMPQAPTYPPEALKSLHKACVYGLYDVVNDFLKSGQDPNSRDQDGYVPLHWAAVNDRFDVVFLEGGWIVFESPFEEHGRFASSWFQEVRMLICVEEKM